MGSKKYPTLNVREVQAILKARGFALDRTKGSHEQWTGEIKDEPRTVTVDTHYDEFSVTIIKSMIRQSGLTREQFYCSTKKTAKRINMKLDPELSHR